MMIITYLSEALTLPYDDDDESAPPSEKPPRRLKTDEPPCRRPSPPLPTIPLLLVDWEFEIVTKGKLLLFW